MPSVGAANFAAKKGLVGSSYPGRAGLQSAVRMSTALNATVDGTNDPETTNEENEITDGTVIKKKDPAPAPDGD